MRMRMAERAGLAVMFVMLCAPLAAWSQQFPSRTVTMIIPAPPGGPTDLGGRIVGRALADVLGASVVADNRAGAATMLGTSVVARAAPDGHTIGIVANIALTTQVAIGNTEMPYRIEDLYPLGTVAFDVSVFLAKSDSQWKSLRDAADFARQNPKKLSYGAAGVGSMGHLNMEIAKQAFGADITFVPYAGTAPINTALLGGHIDLGVAAFSATLPFITSGKFKALAVTSPKRLSRLPEVPTLAELGRPDTPNLWFGLFAPAKTPAPVLEKLTAAFDQAMKDPKTLAEFDRLGLIADGRGPEATRKLIADEIRTLTGLAKTIDLKPR